MSDKAEPPAEMRHLNIEHEPNTHVIYDIRTGRRFTSSEHSPLDAVLDVFRRLEETEPSFWTDELRSRCISDVMKLAIALKTGVDPSRIKAFSLDAEEDSILSKEYFTEQEIDRYMLFNVGPFYTLNACRHTKNGLPMAQFVAKHFNEKDEREGLTPEEETLALAARHYVGMLTIPGTRCDR